MKRRLVIAAALFIALVSAAAQAADDQVIFVVRHAERADGGGARGGMSEDPPLSTEGVGRALRLATMLRTANVKHIFATTFQRTRQTAEPLAKQQHLEINTAASATVDMLVETLRKTEGRSLVVGHSNTVPQILSKLGVTETVDIDDEFDNFFIVVLKPTGAPTLIRLKY